MSVEISDRSRLIDERRCQSIVMIVYVDDDGGDDDFCFVFLCVRSSSRRNENSEKSENERMN